VLGVPGLGINQRGLAILALLQVALRDRRPVVGQILLARHEHDRALEAAFAQLAGGAGGGDAPADQQDV